MRYPYSGNWNLHALNMTSIQLDSFPTTWPSEKGTKQFLDNSVQLLTGRGYLFYKCKMSPTPEQSKEKRSCRTLQILFNGATVMQILLLNPLGPKSDQHQFSPNNMSRSTRVKVMRITKIIDYQRENALILNQILSTIHKRNVWRSVWRICMWILGIKGLRSTPS